MREFATEDTYMFTTWNGSLRMLMARLGTSLPLIEMFGRMPDRPSCRDGTQNGLGIVNSLSVISSLFLQLFLQHFWVLVPRCL